MDPKPVKGKNQIRRKVGKGAFANLGESIQRGRDEEKKEEPGN